MAEIGYPVFEGGMTLTKDDLNTLREFLDVKDGILGRLIGFGIACGLDVTVAGGQFRVRPGLALDQDGRGIMVEDGVVVPAAATAPPVAFGFIDPKPQGLTPVLILGERTVEVECSDETCEAHAPLRCFQPRVVVAAGRLATGADVFATEPLLDVTPLTVDKAGNVVGDLVKVRKAIVDRLTAAGVKLSPAARKRLVDLVPGDTAALRVYRAAFLNEVLFAAIELMRCRALHAEGCLRDEPVPGVALGWLSPTGAWDCRYAHHFDPNVGLVTALLGGDCGDPCELALQRLDTLLLTYVEPAKPPSGGGGGPRPGPGGPKWPDFPICGPKGRYGPMVFDACRLEILPSDKFDPLRYKQYWRERPTLIPEKDLPRPQEWFTDPIERFKPGTIALDPAFGGDADLVKNVLEETLAPHVTQPDVRIVTQEEALALEGFQTQVAFGLGDTVVLVKDAADRVVRTGVVTSQFAIRNAGSAIQTAQNAAAEAAAAVANIQVDIRNTVIQQVAAQVPLVTQQVTQQIPALVTQQVTQQIPALVTQQVNFQLEARGVLAPEVTALEADQIANVFNLMSQAIDAAATEEQAGEVRARLGETQTLLRGLRTAGTFTMSTSQRTVLTSSLLAMADAASVAGAPLAQVNLAREAIQELEQR